MGKLFLEMFQKCSKVFFYFLDMSTSKLLPTVTGRITLKSYVLLQIVKL